MGKEQLTLVMVACVVAACGGSTVHDTSAVAGDHPPEQPIGAGQPDSGEAGTVPVNDPMVIDGSTANPVKCSGTAGAQLCGRPDAPCKLVTDEIIGPLDFLSLALAPGGPRALGITSGRNEMTYAKREGTTWTSEPLGTDGTWYSIVPQPNGEPLAAIYGPAYATTIWSRTESGWHVAGRIASFTGAWPGSAVSDPSGQVHLLGVFGASNLAYAKWHPGSDATVQDIGGGDYHAAIVLSRSGVPNLAYKSLPPDIPPAMAWSRLNGELEAVGPLSTFGSEDDVPIGLALVGQGEGQPFIMYARMPRAGPREIALARRNAPGDWSVFSAAKGDLSEPDPAELPPARYNYRTVRSVAVLADECGEARFIYAEFQVSGAAFSMEHGPVSILATLYVAWLEGDEVHRTVLVDKLWVPSINGAFGRAVSGADGTIHMTRREAAPPLPDQVSGPVATGSRYLVFSK